MPLSRKRKKKKKKRSNKKRPKPYQVIKQNLFRLENPFDNTLPFEERLQILKSFGENSTKEFEENYLELINYFKEFDQLYLCSFCAYYFTTNQEGIDEEAINGFLEFPPFYVETLQAFSLMHQREISAKPLHDNVEKFKKLIQDLNKNQTYGYFKLIQDIKNQDELSEIMLRTEMMVHTLAVRNWAYVSQIQTITKELAYLVENEFEEEIGFNPIDFLIIFSGLVSLTEEKLNNHRKKIFSFAKQKNYSDVVDTYNEVFNTVNKNKDDKERFWSMVGKNLRNLKGFLLMHSDLFLSDIYIFKTEEVYIFFEGKYQKNIIKNILEKLSLSFGELSKNNKNFIFLDNPIHSKPFIKLEIEDGYFSSIMHMFDHLSLSIENFIWSKTNLKKQYLIKKGKYLENKIEELFRQSFPNAKIYAGSQWQNNNEDKVYENDLLIVIEDFAIIVECKSGSISSPAKRGAPERLFRTMKELVIDPSKQAIRFENFLKNGVNKLELNTKSGKKNSIDISKTKYFIPLGITLSHLGSIGCNLKKLIAAKIIDSKLEELAPSISFTDLECIFQILTSQAEKIHYLSRRREFEAHVHFNGDELDLFAFYLDNGFNIGDAEYDGLNHFELTGKSKELDPYFIGKNRCVQVKKPLLKKTKYWQDLLNKIGIRSKNWLINSYILLNLPEADQVNYEKNLEILKNRILKGKVKKKYNYMLMKVGPERRRYTLAAFPYKDIDKEARDNLINDIIT